VSSVKNAVFNLLENKNDLWDFCLSIGWWY
jgi:hypothetical protein